MKCVTQLFGIIIVDIDDFRDGFFSLFKKFLSRESPMRETFSCLQSCARGMKPQRKQTDVKDVQMVVTSQKMEKVKKYEGLSSISRHFLLRLNGWKTH